MRDDLADRVPGVECRFERLCRHPGQVIAGDPANEFLTLAGEHRAGNDLDPPLICSSLHEQAGYQELGIGNRESGV